MVSYYRLVCGSLYFILSGRHARVRRSIHDLAGPLSHSQKPKTHSSAALMSPAAASMVLDSFRLLRILLRGETPDLITKSDVVALKIFPILRWGFGRRAVLRPVGEAGDESCSSLSDTLDLVVCEALQLLFSFYVDAEETDDETWIGWVLGLAEYYCTLCRSMSEGMQQVRACLLWQLTRRAEVEGSAAGDHSTTSALRQPPSSEDQQHDVDPKFLDRAVQLEPRTSEENGPRVDEEGRELRRRFLGLRANLAVLRRWEIPLTGLLGAIAEHAEGRKRQEVLGAAVESCVATLHECVVAKAKNNGGERNQKIDRRLVQARLSFATAMYGHVAPDLRAAIRETVWRDGGVLQDVVGADLFRMRVEGHSADGHCEENGGADGEEEMGQ